MQDCKSVNTPLASHFRLSTALSLQSDKEKEYISCVPYANAIESMMYVLICIHPNILQAISVTVCKLTQ